MIDFQVSCMEKKIESTELPPQAKTMPTAKTWVPCSNFFRYSLACCTDFCFFFFFSSVRQWADSSRQHHDMSAGEKVSLSTYTFNNFDGQSWRVNVQSNLKYIMRSCYADGCGIVSNTVNQNWNKSEIIYRYSFVFYIRFLLITVFLRMSLSQDLVCLHLFIYIFCCPFFYLDKGISFMPLYSHLFLTKRVQIRALHFISAQLAWESYAS